MKPFVTAIILTILTFGCSKKDVTPQLTTISLNCPTNAIKLGETFQFTATPQPSSAVILGKINWSSSDQSILQIDNNGMVKGNSVGKATITATYSTNTTISKSCEVSVIPIAASSIKLSESTITLTIGGIKNLIAQIEPNNTSDKSISWISDNTSIATVDQSGNVTAIGIGETNIKVKTNSGGLEATCLVKVESVKPISLTLNPTSYSGELGSSFTIVPTILPSNTTFKEITWTSSDNNVATVNLTGLVNCSNVGTATITATTKEGDIKATCSVTVTSIKPTALTLSPSSYGAQINSTFTIIPSFQPSNTTYKELTWTSSDNNIATVSANGTVNCKDIGSATITATTKEGNIKASTTVNVWVDKIILDKANTELLYGENLTINASYRNGNGIIKPYNDVIWQIDNSTIASIIKSGNSVVFSSKAVGSVTLMATSGQNQSANTSILIESKDIDYFIKGNLSLVISSYMNGFFSGTFASTLTNNSTKPIKVISYSIINGANDFQMATSTNFGDLNPNYMYTTSSVPLSNVYKPYALWKFSYNSKEYTIIAKTFY